MRRTPVPPATPQPRSGALSAMSLPRRREDVGSDFVHAVSITRQQLTSAEAIYLPAAACCYAIVQYDPMSVRGIRRVVGLFGGMGEAEDYAKDNCFYPYDIVPATAVIPQLH